MHPPAVWVDQHVWASTDSIITAVIKHALLLGTEDALLGFSLLCTQYLALDYVLDFFPF